MKVGLTILLAVGILVGGLVVGTVAADQTIGDTPRSDNNNTQNPVDDDDDTPINPPGTTAAGIPTG